MGWVFAGVLTDVDMHVPSANAKGLSQKLERTLQNTLAAILCMTYQLAA